MGQPQCCQWESIEVESHYLKRMYAQENLKDSALDFRKKRSRPRTVKTWHCWVTLRSA